MRRYAEGTLAALERLLAPHPLRTALRAENDRVALGDVGGERIRLAARLLLTHAL